jgi:hypothetical protein
MEQLQTISLKSVYPMVKDGGISAVFNVQLFRLFQSVQFVQKRSGVFNMSSIWYDKGILREPDCMKRRFDSIIHRVSA